MSEDDNFKTAKNIALESSLKSLDADVKIFLRDKFADLDDDDIVEIAEKFLTKNEPHFVRENLNNDEMICYAEIEAQINLDALDNFIKNFAVFKLEKKVDKTQKIIDDLNNKFELCQRFLPQLLDSTIEVINHSNWDNSYYARGLAYYNLQNYSQAISDFNQAIRLNPNFYKSYYYRGVAYKALGEIDKAEADFEKARELGYEG